MKVKYSKYIKPYLSAFILGPIFMIIEVIGEVVMPALLQKIIDEGVTEKADISYIVGVGLLMVAASFVMMAGGVLGAYFAIKASSGFANDLRKDLFRKIQEFSFANIDKFSTGSLVTRLTNDVTVLQNMITMLLRMALRAPGMFIAAIISVLMLNPKLAVVMFIVIPILSMALAIIIKTGFPRFGIMQKKLDELNTTTQENLTNIRVVKSFVREDFEEEKFKAANKELRDRTLKAMDIVIFMMPVMTLTMNITSLVVVYLGGNQVIAGDMSIGQLNQFTTYVTQILMSLMMISHILLNSSRALASSKRIREVLETEATINDRLAKNKEAKVEKGKIEFKNVNFRYYKDNEEWVLENINCIINPGETVGIIGSTGCGKTSMVSLIPRLYDTDEGEILVDDIDVRDYRIENLRDGVGMVLQKNVLFSGSIIENIKWGNSEASDDEVIKYASASQAHNFVSSFKEGYDTFLEQGGANVSGGQKQRLCIARALLKKPKILILDDSTSAVDTATERKIRESFKTDLKDTTKLIIAQRISSVIDADKIIVMDDGKISGVGSHKELIEKCEEYKEIYYSQVNKEENKDE